MTNPEKTALVSLLPAADHLLDVATAVNPALVRPGIPAHATILYPFLPTAELPGRNSARLRDIAATLPAADVLLTEVVTEPGFVAVGIPALQPALDAARAAWPELLPYGGRFGPTPPVHLTIAMGASGPEVERVAAEVRRHLPVQVRIEAMQVVALTAGGWQHCLSLPLG